MKKTLAKLHRARPPILSFPPSGRRGLALLTGSVFLALGPPAPPAQGATLRALSPAQLVAAADVIVHATVTRVDDNLAPAPHGPFRTALRLQIHRTLKTAPELLAPAPAPLELVIPGGRGFGKRVSFPGLPQLKAGQEVVLFLERNPLGFIYVGLGQGVFGVADNGTVTRDLSETMLLSHQGRPTSTHTLSGARWPTDLPGLVEMIEGHLPPPTPMSAPVNPR